MNKNSRERLEYGKRYYYLQMDGSYNSAPDERNLTDNILYKANNYFYTKQETEKASEEFMNMIIGRWLPEHFYMEVEYFCFSSDNDIFATDWEIF